MQGFPLRGLWPCTAVLPMIGSAAFFMSVLSSAALLSLPVLLVPGADLTSMLQRFGDRKGWLLGQRLHVVSLGQGQGLLAETMIKQAAAAGEWVCLQNCHLAASWMRRLEEKV